uniref:Uncharacterized protein n=1 Tax=Arundo donax TaxID=35708 RepID=A0A0A8XXB7_ARUDO
MIKRWAVSRKRRKTLADDYEGQSSPFIGSLDFFLCKHNSTSTVLSKKKHRVPRHNNSIPSDFSHQSEPKEREDRREA